jgi:hypothetical protein
MRYFLITTQKKLARTCVDQVIEFCVKDILKLAREHLLFKMFSVVFTPGPPGGGNDPTQHPSPHGRRPCDRALRVLSHAVTEG